MKERKKVVGGTKAHSRADLTLFSFVCWFGEGLSLRFSFPRRTDERIRSSYPSSCPESFPTSSLPFPVVTVPSSFPLLSRGFLVVFSLHAQTPRNSFLYRVSLGSTPAESSFGSRTFPGQRISSGSNASLIIRMSPTAPAPASSKSSPLFPTPTPCSPVQVPP